MQSLRFSLFFLATALASLGSVQASLMWTGNGDGISLFQEANFLDCNGNVPANNTINGNTVVTAVTGGLIEISSGTGQPSAAGSIFRVGSADLTVANGKVLRVTGTNSIQSTGGSALSILNGGLVDTQFLTNFDVVLDGASTLQLRGGNDAIVGTTSIDVLDTGSIIRFNAETPADVITQHFGDITFQGSPLVSGLDPLVQEPGDNVVFTDFMSPTGTQLNFVVPVPEPGLAGLFLLVGATCFMRRRRC